MKSKTQKFFSFRSNSVLYRLTMAFSLFFLGPLLGFLFLSIESNLFGTNELLYCLVGLLISTLFGYIIMRQISIGIARVENQMAEKVNNYKSVMGKIGEDELSNIAAFADMLSENIKKTDESLTRRMEEIHALRELGSLSAFHVSAQSLAALTLQRSIEVTGAVSGCILLLTNTTLTCRHILGDGITMAVAKKINAEGFPAIEAIRKNSPVFLRDNRIPQWSRFFSNFCSCVAVVPFATINNTTLIAVLAAGRENTWDETTLDFLSTYFSSAGSALKIQEIGIRKKETSDELKTVLSIVKMINSNLQEENLLAAITQKLQQIIPHQWVGLALVDRRDGDLFLLQTFNGKCMETQSGVRVAKKGSLFHMAMDSGEAVAIDSLDRVPDCFEKRLLQELHLQSCIIESLHSGGKTTGVICLAGREPSGFSKKDKRLFTMVALGVAIAMEQTRLLALERTKRAELEVLNKIGTTLSAHTIKAGRALQYILEKLTGLVAVETASIMILEFDALVIHAATGAFSRELIKKRISLGHGVAGYVVTVGESVIVGNVKENPQFFSDIDEKTGFETRSLLCVPMIASGRVIGVIELLNRVGTVFGEDDLQTVKTVAASVAIALENSRLYNETKYIAKKERFIRTIFQKYVPEEIVTDILERGGYQQMTVGEKKVVTIFNVDIRGYSRMSRQASTEDVVHVLNFFFQKMGNIIISHKGVLDKYLGDGLLAIFGAPVASANPALDAVLAAQEMIEAVEELSIIALDRCGVPIKLGISINTGEAIVGNIGFEKKMEYTVIGDVVNETFRLQDLTKNKFNSILIGEATFQEVKSMVRTRPYGLKKLDDCYINVYEVVTEGEGDTQAYLSMPENISSSTEKLH